MTDDDDLVQYVEWNNGKDRCSVGENVDSFKVSRIDVQENSTLVCYVQIFVIKAGKEFLWKEIISNNISITHYVN